MCTLAGVPEFDAGPAGVASWEVANAVGVGVGVIAKGRGEKVSARGERSGVGFGFAGTRFSGQLPSARVPHTDGRGESSMGVPCLF